MTMALLEAYVVCTFFHTVMHKYLLRYIYKVHTVLWKCGVHKCDKQEWKSKYMDDTYMIYIYVIPVCVE